MHWNWPKRFLLSARDRRRSAPWAPPDPSSRETFLSDFIRLNDPAKAFLQIKLDGHIEACVLAAHSQHIWIEEALSLTAAAVMREFSTRQFDSVATAVLVDLALSQTYPAPADGRTKMVS